MLTESVLKTHFLGNEGFKWFIGQVTADPKWRENSTKYGYRAKVRILGFHPSTNEVKDEELPWAHFLVPPNLGAGEAHGGTSFALQGGETVLGFFLDGADAQQPIIIGSLYSSETIKNVKMWNDVIKKGTSSFEPFQYNPKKNIGLHNKVTGATGIGTTTSKPQPQRGIRDENGKIDGQQTNQNTIDNQQIRMKAVPKCDRGDGVMSHMVKSLRSFIKGANDLQKFKTGYLDPVLNEIQSLPALAGQAAEIISGLFSIIIKEARKWILTEIYDKFAKLVNSWLPDSLMKEIALLKATDSLYCVFEKLLNGLFDLVFNFLISLAGNLINLPLCAAEQFIGGLIASISDELQEGIQQALQPIQGIIGGVNTAFYYINKALGYAKKALNFISCEENGCEDNVYDWIMNFGPVPQDVIDFQRTIDLSTKLDNLKTNATDAVKGWFGGKDDTITGVGGKKLSRDEALSNIDALIGDCDPFIFDCGPPKVEIFGGGGVGAIASAVVNQYGNIIGVDMQDFGIGYTSAPYVAFVDSCDNGRGAIGRANIVDGKVVGITILEQGGGYIAPSEDTFNGDGKQVAGVLNGVEIVNTGIGYSEADLIESPCGILKPVLDEFGRIVGTEVVSNKPGCNILPDLTINTTTGFGAVLKPTLEFKAIEDLKQPVDPVQVISIVDCVSKYK